MKNFIPFLVAFLMFNMNTFAQNTIQLNIHHKLGTADLETNTLGTNNLSHQFSVRRLEFYISEISIIHDGGMETQIDDVWILVNGRELVQVDLGVHDITNVEGVRFHTGVDPAHNHLDPASHPADHPLAPKNPSMHWGWDPGYRFVVIEGQCGNNLSHDYQLHGLGDDYYFENEISLSAVSENNTLAIHVDADYSRALENIDISGGLIVHGGDGDCRVVMENFRDYVFSASSIVNSTIDFSEVNGFKITPNPTINGTSTFVVEASEALTYDVLVSDVLGRQIQRFDGVQRNEMTEVTALEAGLYFITLIKEDQAIITKRLIVK